MIIYNTDDMKSINPDMTMEEVRSSIFENEILVSIVIVAYNRLEKTKECVSNLLRYTKNVKYVLYLIDHGSDPEILDYFKSVDYENKVIVRVTRNVIGTLPFNRLVFEITTPYVVLIPNDVIVTKNWLENLLECACSDPKIGMVVPASTNISNMQEEYLEGFSDLDEMQRKAEQFNVSDWRKWEERIRLIPSLVLFKREVFNMVGTFDFGFIHDYGDDDFSFRVRRADYKLILCRDTFVHHNHYLQERDFSSEAVRANRGKEEFRRKYHGIDAWDDCNNHIVEFQDYDNLNFSLDGTIKILGVDVKCGTPVLDVKNQLRRKGYSSFHIDTFTTDLKYYIDLNSISEHTEHGCISNIFSKYRGKKFEAIVLGEPINSYDKPKDVLLDLMALLEKNGVLIFNLYNCDNIFEYLWQQGCLEQRENVDYKRLSYEHILNELKDILLRKIDIQFTTHLIQDHIKEFIDRSAYIGLKEGREEKIQSLYVKEYWFWIQKG